MKVTKSQLKTIIKPIINECIKEILFESSLLSNIISEVVKGLNTNVINEQQQHQQPSMFPLNDMLNKPTEMQLAQREERQMLEEKMEQQRQERIRRMDQAYSNINKKLGIDVFEGTTPLSNRQSGHHNHAQDARQTLQEMTSITKPLDGPAESDPLKDMDPYDPGVDLSMIPGASRWAK